ncbi:hypothetical protein O988_00104 [Pseudogymnoascus sp. VKM F-3808]|nr:hypothetical protein O988_00104 [Pseudogymnoascus sp. VKM F-3808]
MGNSATKEQRPSSAVGYHSRHQDASSSREAGSANPSTNPYAARSGRGSRHDLSFLGIGSTSHPVDGPEVRKETKQEREARKLEKERVAREKERARSMKEEHVDGGYLVTQGVYTGTEDFSKPVVRQFMIERRIAPFWYGLNDFKNEWTEHQLVAAAKGLPIPAADEIPLELERPPTVESPRGSTNNINNLTVPIAGRSDSYASDNSSHLSPSNSAFPASPTSPLPNQPPHLQASSPFRPRSKTLASLTSKNPPQSDIVPREVQLPVDPYVNGLRMEAFLYKDATECPICFIYYPPYLNKTRCCDQPICSECFVQIKRPDPHPPEHEHNDGSSPSPPPPPSQENPETLVSEPANCPYCQQAEFGVTYEAPPFRRGLAYANLGPTSYGSAMSSSSSLNSAVSPSLKPIAGRRRTTSVSASDATVITTDKVRPDWATKLANARNHAARRSAAATALHTAAYMMGNGSSESRGFGFSSRFRNRSSPADSSAGTPTDQGPDTAARLAAFSTLAEQQAQRQREAQADPSARRRRSRVEDLEEMMMMEAIRQSLVAEEERKRKDEKEAAKEAKKEAKKREKDNKKAEKAAKKGVYGSGATSLSGSALSLVLPGVGRRRGNSGSSAIAREAAANKNDKGKDVDRGAVAPSTSSSDGPSHVDEASSALPTMIPAPPPFRHHVEEPTPELHNQEFAPPHSPTTTAPEKPSHLRQMSNASSPASSYVESVHGSLKNDFPESSSSVAYVL